MGGYRPALEAYRIAEATFNGFVALLHDSDQVTANLDIINRSADPRSTDFVVHEWGGTPAAVLAQIAVARAVGG